MWNRNDKVPMAILSCFLVAFVLQGILKLSGVFVFEKALEWEIFNIIDNHLWLQIIYYSLIMILIVYCLSFALTSKSYSNKWYHYVLITLTSIGVTIIRMTISISYSLNMFLDILVYIIMPLIINITTEDNYRLFHRNLTNLIITITIQISLYFCYLGLTYWSSMLNSIVITDVVWVSTSRHFLIYFELYIGLITFMFGMNLLIKNIKRRNNMVMPTNIASEEAKEKELERLEKKGK